MSPKLPQSISEEDLHAFADGQLAIERSAEVELYLSANPELALEVAEWILLNEQIRTLVANAADAPQVTKVSNTKPSWLVPFRAVAASLAIFAIGAASGSVTAIQFMRSQSLPIETALLSEESQTNFLVYASDKRHPTEVGADEKDHLLTWLSKRVGNPIIAPDISAQGFTLIGGRLVTYAEKPAALIMYESAKGERLTLTIGHNEDNQDTSFKYDEKNDVQTLYWIDGPLGYALSASVGKDRLQAVAHVLNGQL